MAIQALKQLKVLHVTSASPDSGAGIAVATLHERMLAFGLESAIYSVYPDTSTLDGREAFIGPSPFERLLRRFQYWWFRLNFWWHGYSGETPMSAMGWGRLRSLQRALISADIVHFHWVGNSQFSFEDLNLKEHPAKVWTVRDWWPMTGGCHVPITSCDKFLKECGSCPLLPRERISGLTRRQKLQKRSLTKGVAHYIVQSESMVKQLAHASGVIESKVSVIPSTVDDRKYYWENKEDARKVLGIPDGYLVIAIGASNLTDSHKGYEVFSSSKLFHGLQRYMFVTFGDGKIDFPHNVETKNFGYVTDTNLLRNIYAASDIFACPSTRESFGKVVLEAALCGTPSVAFPGTGGAEIIKRVNGGMIACGNTSEAFLEACEDLISVIQSYDGRSLSLRAKDIFSIESALVSHLSVYHSVLDEVRST